MASDKSDMVRAMNQSTYLIRCTYLPWITIFLATVCLFDAFTLRLQNMHIISTFDGANTHSMAVPLFQKGSLAKVFALSAPVKGTIAQVYSEKGGCLEIAGATNAAATYEVGGVDIKTELGSQAPSVENPSTEVSLLQSAQGADADHCTLTLTTAKLGKDFTDAAQTITFTGDFSVNPVAWTTAVSAGITGNAAAVATAWR